MHLNAQNAQYDLLKFARLPVNVLVLYIREEDRDTAASSLHNHDMNIYDYTESERMRTIKPKTGWLQCIECL